MDINETLIVCFFIHKCILGGCKLSKNILRMLCVSMWKDTETHCYHRIIVQMTDSTWGNG